MKRIIFLVAFALLSLTGYAQMSYQDVHPRLYLNAQDFAKLKSDVLAGDNAVLNAMHDNIMGEAEESLKANPITYYKDESAKRILHVSNDAIRRIMALGYAYRFTGDTKYSAAATDVLERICDFPDWNPSHFLDTGEMALAVGAAYDWMYDALPESTKSKARENLMSKAFAPSNNEKQAWFYQATNNWNQVCNAGLVSAALAVLPSSDTCAARIVDCAVKSNRKCMEHTYYPDGNYPEGPGYWGYGTTFQVAMLCALESVLGHDFGLSQIEGFLKTGAYQAWSYGSTGRPFNFSDNRDNKAICNALWYFAYKTGDYSLVKRNSEMYLSGVRSRDRMLFLALIYADKVGRIESAEPQGRLYSGRGLNPIVICRTGMGEQDLYLGIKAGYAGQNHAHMDAGSFVFDAYGVRWAQDVTYPAYAQSEVELRNRGKDLWDMRQGSYRWQIPGYNNRYHNTLTVNDRDHEVKGKAKIVEKYETQDRLGAKLDLTDVFGGDLQSAERTVCICDDSYLCVVDKVVAPRKRPASVRWTLASDATPEIVEDGIILTKDGVKMRLEVSGIDAQFRLWPSDPHEGATLCGFIFQLKPGGKATATVTLKKI